MLPVRNIAGKSSKGDGTDPYSGLVDTLLEVRPDMLFRREPEGVGRLLIKNTVGENVYSYDPTSGGLSSAPVDLWNAGSGEVGGTCGLRRGLRSGPRLRIVKRQLFADDLRIT